MRIISTEKLPIKMWLDDVEDKALEQAKNLANLPFAYKHIAIMPDCHVGYGMPIGGVMATEGVVSPNCTGVDIGCGMCAVKTSLTKISTAILKEIMGKIREAIPVGFDHHKDKQDENLMPKIGHPADNPIVFQQYNSALKQLGTLGGGNHFIEIQKGSDGYIWIMIHSGSRNLGFKVANHYNKIAQELNEKYHSVVDKKQELAFLPLETDEAKAYLREMDYCVEFALANRQLMMDRTKEVINSPTFCGGDIEFAEPINIAHNYAVFESHFGKNVLVHRKGATLARKGTVGIIPGSLGSPSYITQGLGNQDSFCSSPHGAGRIMGRKQAQQKLDLKKEIKTLNDQNIIHGLRNKNDLDEATGSYKNIDEVIESSKDLVKILVKLQPLASIKG